MRSALFLMLSLFTFHSKANAGSEYCIAFVHIGQRLPEYLNTAVAQARLFNLECPIYLLANAEAISTSLIDWALRNVHPISIESLTRGQDHQYFLQKMEGSHFFYDALERFFYLDDFIQHYRMTNVFHLQNDLMLYIDLENKVSLFQQYYHGAPAFIFDCSTQSVPSFVYISNPADSQCIITSIIQKTTAESCSMPFDDAGLGQFFEQINLMIGGADSDLINELFVFNPMFFHFDWLKDENNRHIPFISRGDRSYPAASLRIPSKNLAPFYSLKDH